MFKMIGRILNITGKYKGRVLAAFVFSFFKAMASKIPIMLAFIIISKFMVQSMTARDCLFAGIGMVLFLILQILFQYSSDRLQSAAGYMIFADIRMDLGAHLRRLPMGYFTEGNVGKISSVLSTDMVFIEEKCMTALADLMSDLFSQLIMVLFMMFFNPVLGAATAIIVVLISAVGSRVQSVDMKHSYIKQQQSEELTDSVLDFIEGIGISKSYNLMGEKSAELTENFQKSCEANLDFEIAHTPSVCMLFMVCGAGSSVILGLSLYLWHAGLLAAPFLMGMVLFVMDLFIPIKAFYSQITRLTVMSSCMDRIESVFAETGLPNDGASAITGRHEVRFDHVSFGYGTKEVLHDISFTMEPNTMTALVGPSGGGNSTVANLLTRFWNVKYGKITIGGQDIRDVALKNLMEEISVVFHHVYLFQDTIYNNISMGRMTTSREEVIEAAKKARCYDFIMQLPDGFDTIIGEGGATLSGGEKQRISIARCILKDAPIVILDEATASVDADNESYIQQAITELCRGKTLLVIAHRLNTIRNADNIIAIADGRIVEQGTHDSLIAQNGLYKNFITVRQSSCGWSGTAEAI